MIVSHKIALDATDAQRTWFSQHFYASSKMCSHCGHKKKELLLSERQYHCSECGHSIDRDINAAINLKTLAVGQTES